MPALGMLALTSGCRPGNLNWTANPEAVTKEVTPFLTAKIKRAGQKDLLLGYPINMNTPPDDFFAWRKQLLETGMGSFAFNNVGNPFKDSAIPFNSHDFEREVILRFGQLLAFSAQDTWGFLSHSGTDSNMHGMYMGRTILKGRTGVMPKAYFTNEAHYSIQILRDLLGLETVLVNTQPDGGIDPDDLKQKLAENANYPALVVATVGTTFKGAVDKINLIQEMLKGHPSYLHLDAALFGGYLPHTSFADEVLQRTPSNSKVQRYDSIAISCHKFFGFPSPAGLFITTESLFNEFSEWFAQVHNPEYIHHVPGTITCSRDAVKPAEFYFFSTPTAMAKQAEDAKAMLQNTIFLMKEMQSHFAHLQPTRSNELSNTIYFRKPGDWIVEKYSLATMHLQGQHYAHALVMPHVTRKIISEFLTDLHNDSTKQTKTTSNTPISLLI